MHLFHGFTQFNGNTVIVELHTAWSDPSYWNVEFDDGRKLTVYESFAHTPSNQLSTLKYFSSMDSWNEPKGKAQLLQTFAEDWATFNNNDGLVKMLLDYVGYNEDNADEDILLIQKLEHSLNVEVEKFQEYVSNLTVDDANGDYTQLDFTAFDNEMKKLKNAADRVKEEAEIPKMRISVFRRMQSGEQLGLGWTNKTFWRDFSDTNEGKTIAAILYLERNKKVKPFDGLTEFNSKAVRASYNQGWDTPGEWSMQFDNGDYIVIDDALALKPKNQLDFLHYILSDAANPEYRIKYIHQVFESNWDIAGSSEDVVRLVLRYVGYDEENAAYDEAAVKRLREETHAHLMNMEKFFSGKDEYLKEPAKFFEDKAETFRNLARKNNELSEAPEARLEVFKKLRDGMPVGIGWTNDTFWRDFGDTESGEQVADILATELPPEA